MGGFQGGITARSGLVSTTTRGSLRTTWPNGTWEIEPSLDPGTTVHGANLWRAGQCVAPYSDVPFKAMIDELN